MKQKITWTILFLFSIQFLSAQASLLEAIVTDARNNTPLPFATILVDETGAGMFADSTGRFSLQASPGMARVSVTVSMLGYAKQTFELRPGAAAARLALEPLSEALGEVVVSGTLKEMSRDASPVPVEVFTPKFFARNPTPSLFDALQIVNGVQPQLNCNVCNTGDIHINGLEGPYTMVTIDGMPIVSALSTVYGLSGIPNSMVERIEIVKGPASTLYGSEAVGGLINVITKDPDKAPRLSADLNGTAYGEYTLDAATAFRKGKLRSLLSFNGFWFDTRHDVNGDNFTDMTLQKRLSVFNKWSFERPDFREASMAVRYVREYRWGGEMLWTPAWQGADSIYGENILTRRLETIGKYRLPGRENLLFSFSYNHHRQDSYYGTTRFDAIQQIAFGQLSWHKAAGKQQDLLFGAAWRYTLYDDNTPVTATAEGLNRVSRTSLPGIFAQHEWRLGSRHTLLSGLRFDHHPLHGGVWSPRLNWKWSLNALNALRLGLGNGFRVANVFSEEHAALTGSRAVVLAADLQPERSWNANLNYNTKFFPRFGFVGLDASLFYTYFSNRILADYTTDPQLVIFDNLDGYGVSRGISLNMDWNFTSGLKILAGGTWQEVFSVEHGLRQAQMHAAPFSATWSASYTLQRQGLTIDYTGNLYSPMPLPVVPNDFRPGHSPWFSLQNIQLTQKIKGARAIGLECYAGIKNLLGFLPRDPLLRPFDPFDKHVNDPVSNPYGYTFDTTYNYAPMQGRRFFAGLRGRF